MIDWKKVVDDLPEGIAIFDDQGRVVYVNKRMLEKTGVKDEKVKMDPLSLIQPR
ncbi:PAS domain-containing protein [Archaeoglobus sp.]